MCNVIFIPNHSTFFPTNCGSRCSDGISNLTYNGMRKAQYFKFHLGSKEKCTETRLFNENIRSVSKEGMLRADFGSRHLPFWKANIRRPLRLIKEHRNLNLFKRLWFLWSSWRVLVKQLQWSCFTSTLHESLLSRHGNLLTRCICAKSSPGRSWTEIINCLPFLLQSISTWLLANLYAFKNILLWFDYRAMKVKIVFDQPALRWAFSFQTRKLFEG